MVLQDLQFSNYLNKFPCLCDPLLGIGSFNCLLPLQCFGGPHFKAKLRFCEMNLKKMCVTFMLALQPRGYSRSSGLPTSLQRLDLETGTCWWIQRAVLWPSSAPSQGTQRALILLCQPLSTPAHYTTSWETSGVYFGIINGTIPLWNVK